MLDPIFVVSWCFGHWVRIQLLESRELLFAMLLSYVEELALDTRVKLILQIVVLVLLDSLVRGVGKKGSRIAHALGIPIIRPHLGVREFGRVSVLIVVDSHLLCMLQDLVAVQV